MCPEMSQFARRHERYMLGACIAMDKALERQWGFRVPITARKAFWPRIWWKETIEMQISIFFFALWLILDIDSRSYGLRFGWRYNRISRCLLVHLQVQTPQPFYPCVSWRRTSFLCGGAPKKSGWFEHVSRGLNQHNLPQLDTLGLLNYVGMARCHLNMDGSLPENDPGRCNFVPTTPELVEGANWLDPYRLSRSQRHAFIVLGKPFHWNPVYIGYIP